jgi:hypothetical protein
VLALQLKKMAVYCEREVVLQLFSNGADTYYQQTKYDLGEVIRNTSPRGEGKLGYSRSLEHFTSLLTGDTTNKVDTAKQSENKQQAGRDTQGKTVAFTPATDSVSVSTFCKRTPIIDRVILFIQFLSVIQIRSI